MVRMIGRTAAAIKALAAKRAIPDGWLSIQTTIALPSELADWWRNVTPAERGRVLMAGMSAIAQVENLGENK